MKCPNCKEVRCVTFLALNGFRCLDCGTTWIRDNHTQGISHVSVPRRTAPAVPLELPDAEGWWLSWDYSDRPTPYKVTMTKAGPSHKTTDGVTLYLTTGVYTRAQPPIVAVPEEPRDADAEWLRRLANDRINPPGWLRWRDNFRRIADRLEKGEGA